MHSHQQVQVFVGTNSFQAGNQLVISFWSALQWQGVWSFALEAHDGQLLEPDLRWTGGLVRLQTSHEWRRCLSDTATCPLIYIWSCRHLYDHVSFLMVILFGPISPCEKFSVAPMLLGVRRGCGSSNGPWCGGLCDHCRDAPSDRWTYGTNMVMGHWMSPLNITQPLGIWSIITTIRWCPIFPKWDIYQPLMVI